MLLGAAAACGSDDSDAATGTTGPAATDGDAATEGGSPDVAGTPSFTAERLGGGELASSAFEGQDTVLWFWAPWCTTCRAESPHVLAAAANVAGDVEVIGVAGRGEVSDMEGFVADTGTGDLTHVVDADGSIWSSFGVVTQPTFAFIDASGEVELVVGAQGEQALTDRMQALAAA